MFLFVSVIGGVKFVRVVKFVLKVINVLCVFVYKVIKILSDMWNVVSLKVVSNWLKKVYEFV